MKITERQRKLLDVVKHHHEGQVRKYNGEPYWTHPYEVAEIVSSCKIELAIEIAFCHDLFEDTECDSKELHMSLSTIGYTADEILIILIGVDGLTDEFTKNKYPQHNRAFRKLADAKRLGIMNPSIQSIKYADLIHNSYSILEYDKDFAKVYMKEKRELINHMRNGNIDLLIRCCGILDTYNRR